MRELKIANQRSDSTSSSATSMDKQKEEIDFSVVNDEIFIVEQGGEPISYRCGHLYASTFAISTYGEIQRPSDEYWVDLPQCGDCLAALFKMNVIQCQECGHPIMPGAAVTLMSVDPGFVKRQYAKFVQNSDGSMSVVCCLRFDCCRIPGLFMGNWSGKDFKPAFPHCVPAAVFSAMTGKAVVSSGGKVSVLDLEK